MSYALQESLMVAEILTSHRNLLSAADVPRAVNAALAQVGAAARVDRVYIFEITRDAKIDEVASQRYEWASASVKPEIDNPRLQNVPLRDAGYGRWVDSLTTFQPVYGPIDSFPECEQEILKAQGISSILVLPIFAHGRLWGFVGFDDCSSARLWAEPEVDLLVSLTIALGMRLGRSIGSVLDEATAASLALVGRLLEVHSATFSDTPMELLMQRTQTRVRTLTAAHRYLTTSGASDPILVDDLFASLVPHLNAMPWCGCTDGCAGISLDIQPISMTIDRALYLAVILTDVVAVLCCSVTGDLASACLHISLRSVSGRAELSVTAADADGTPVDTQIPLDGMAHVLVRRVQEHLRATVAPARPAGVLFRLSFPA